jgi:electron transfer flavoprotein-quinone oxidoreductase
VKEKDFSKKLLSSYEKNLRNSFVIEDLKKFRNFPALGEKCPELLSEYPEILSGMITDYFKVNEKSKRIIEKEVIKTFIKKMGIFKLGKNVFNLIRAMGWI